MPPLIVIYDGHCRLCQHGSARLVRLARPGSIQRIDFRVPGALDPYPSITPQDAEAAMQLVSPDGSVVSGAHAVFAALATRPLLRPLLWIYRLPVVRPLMEWLYQRVARNRFRILGRVPSCESGACRIH